ncbi:hypothetical protein D9M71_674190 [compost metagenome]
MFQLFDGHCFSFIPAQAQHLSRRQHDIFQDGQVGEGIPLLEYDADFLPEFVQVGCTVMNFDAVHSNAAFLNLLQAVHAHQQG